MSFPRSRFLRRFLARDDGSMVIPFALWTPVFLGLILATIELGTVTIRHTALERALDQTARDMRLDTGSVAGHAAIKSEICRRAAVLPGCQDMLHLEMVRLDMRAWSHPPQNADCVDHSQTVTPQRGFVHGGSNEMMLLRACYKYRPITPAGTLSASLSSDEGGFTALVSTTAFVHEPN